jgi:hypothetical protein
LTTAKHREIQRANTKKVANRARGMEDYTDWPKVVDDLVDYVIVAWAGVVDKGEPAPCDREHKLRLDAPTKDALLERAGLNEIVAAGEQRAASFRQPA